MLLLEYFQLFHIKLP